MFFLPFIFDMSGASNKMSNAIIPKDPCSESILETSLWEGILVLRFSS